jgi:hypothetical protein
VEKDCGTANQKYEVEFHGVIASTIPSLMKRIEDEYWRIRLKVVEVIGELADHGEP